jgi:N6-L-threonylcarbamoyladenine synthase
MKLLAIETSCDETALAILKIKGPATKPAFSVLSHNVASQIALHAQYGGVFPAMAKREHAKNIVPLFEKTLSEANHLSPLSQKQHPDKLQYVRMSRLEKLLEREREMYEQLVPLLSRIKKPKIDAIAVTTGPGLEPTLWVGINFARALSYIWDIPLVPVNHMEGHILSFAVPQTKESSKRKALNPKCLEFRISNFEFPIVSLLVSGGHTEIVLVKDWGKYKVIGHTVDDAVGEAFDKVARMLDLPYPGGPQISRLAEEARKNAELMRNDTEKNSSVSTKDYRLATSDFVLPRPMLHSGDFNFSYSGLKTAVLYHIRDLTGGNKRTLTDEEKSAIALEFENAAIEVLVKKTMKAMKKYGASTLLVGGGVAANSHLRNELARMCKEANTNTNTHTHTYTVLFPTRELSTDNAIMIGIAGGAAYMKKKKGVKYTSKKLTANGNMALS